MSRARERIIIEGEVQGVGFRPFVYRLARELGVGGFVRNEGAGLVIEAEGEACGGALERFVRRLGDAPPPGARVESIARAALPARGETRLRIAASEGTPVLPRVVPDRVTCADCLAEVRDPASRFCDYPFTNCTACGPRYSIVDHVPYDRAATAMAGFAMCAECRREYEDPGSRRFHAQPIACPRCGPRAVLTDGHARVLACDGAALDEAARLLASGAILALKGLGGYQLLADARDAHAVARLRARKQRPHKPFAVMVRDLDAARAICRVSAHEARLLASPAGPIVLLESRDEALAAALHPCHAETGTLLPTTPLHHLLLDRVPRVLVCTSGNLGDEPICTADDEARERLGAIADAFLAHDRPIRRALDDSLARVIDGAPQVLRLARGYAPQVLPLAGSGDALAVGAQHKNALALGTAGRAVVGPHVGDLASARAVAAMRARAAELPAFFAARPRRIACDRHPDYASSAFAHGQGRPVREVQHHLAHALAVMVERGDDGPLLAVVWDGAGLGSDDTVWGGEFLRVERRGGEVRWQRFAHLRRFRLPGGDAAARDPQRALAGLLWELPATRDRVPQALAALLGRGLAAPWCSSAGRLFDGVAALLGHRERQSYEGMAASLLERDAARAADAGAELAPLALVPGPALVLDWAPLIGALIEAQAHGVSRAALAAGFHARLAEAVVGVARAAGLARVVLTGGCFQNRRLTEGALRGLRGAGFEAAIPRAVPPNDGGIALGQLAAIDGATEHVPRHPRSD